ncbi:ABC transporter permease subunit [Halobellus sp. GM3]|uniref:ABC transporter permease subunit n=1 Tax=Halobellus sp. GM3 TaxID=3458410 RepID=UPI00403DDB22
MLERIGQRRHVTRIASLVSGLLLWQVLIGNFQVINPVLLQPPLVILDTLGTLLGESSFIDQAVLTFRRVIIASIGASAVGIVLGLSMGWNDTVKALSFPVVSAVYPLPKVSLLPLLMLIFGMGERAFIITIAIAATFLVIFNAMRGVEDIGTLYFDVAQDNGVDSAYAYFREILLPGALPMIFTGLRLTLNTALLVTISVEFIAARQGLGAIIWSSWNTLQTAQMYATVLIVMIAGVLITYGLEVVAKYTMPWKETVGTAT